MEPLSFTFDIFLQIGSDTQVYVMFARQFWTVFKHSISSCLMPTQISRKSSDASNRSCCFAPWGTECSCNMQLRLNKRLQSKYPWCPLLAQRNFKNGKFSYNH